MGLDAVELVLEAEESFGIALADDEMVKIVTVWQRRTTCRIGTRCHAKG
jgi:hypothetical protein